MKKYFTAFLICGAFLFIFSVKNVSAAGATSTYEKLDYGTLSATEWNDLLHDFANTWSSVTMQGPVGIATSSPTDGVIKLDVNGVVRATGFLGILNGSVTAGNVTAGTFGSNYGGGNYIFDVASGNVGIGVPSPQVALDVLGSANFTGTVNGSGLCIAGACKDTWGSIVSAGGGNLWSGTTTSAIWNANTGFNVGIGTTNPLHKLNIQGTGSSTAFIAFNNSLNPWPYVGLGYDQIADGLAFNYNSGSTNLNYTGMFMNRSGSVGVGTTNPGTLLDVNGYFRTTGATVSALGAGIVMSNSSGVLYSTSSVMAIGGPYLALSGGTMTGPVNMGDNNITNIADMTVNHKLTAYTIDPLYKIKGINYSTYAASISGGVKEEYVGKINISTKVPASQEYEASIDFSDVEYGGDLWVWREVVEFNKEAIDIAITPYGGFAQVYYLIEGNKLIFRSDRPIEVSYRLIAKRFDWRDWPTRALDQTVQGVEIIR